MQVAVQQVLDITAQMARMIVMNARTSQRATAVILGMEHPAAHVHGSAQRVTPQLAKRTGQPRVQAVAVHVH